MSTKTTKTKAEQTYNLLASGKKVKINTLAKKLYGATDDVSLNKARRIVNYVQVNTDLDVELVETGVYQAL